MSKRSLFWGNASGKLGETVFYRSGGEQRNRTYVQKIKNPRTVAQQAQRVGMLNLNRSYQQCSVILKSSFPTRKANQSGWNAFVQNNSKGARYAVSKALAEKGYCVPGNAMVSKGDIPFDMELEFRTFEATGGTFEYIAIKGFDGFGKGSQTKITLEDIRDDFALKTGGVDGLYNYLTNDGELASLPRDFKITVLVGKRTRAVGGQVAWQIIPYQYQSYANEAGFFNGLVELESQKAGDIRFCFGNITSLASNQNDRSFSGLGICVPDGDIKPYCFAVIVSWTENGVQRVTTSRFASPNSENALSQFDFWKEGSEGWNYVMSEYGASEGSVMATASGSVAASVPSNDTPDGNDTEDEGSDLEG